MCLHKFICLARHAPVRIGQKNKNRHSDSKDYEFSKVPAPVKLIKSNLEAEFDG